MSRKKTIELPEVNFSEDGDIRYLHLATEWIQGSMLIDKPYDIELEYVQRMMAWLLFMPQADVKGAHAMQLGLGAGTITKFCYKKLKMTCTAIELNPGVLHACRGWFRLPPDDERLRVVLADAAEEIRSPEWTGVVDALQVDLYDHEAAAPVLDSEDFYRDCRALLSPNACMTVNLFGRSSSFDDSLQKICAAFGEDAVWARKHPRATGSARASPRPSPARLRRGPAGQSRLPRADRQTRARCHAHKHWP